MCTSSIKNWHAFAIVGIVVVVVVVGVCCIVGQDKSLAFKKVYDVTMGTVDDQINRNHGGGPLVGSTSDRVEFVLGFNPGSEVANRNGKRVLGKIIAGMMEKHDEITIEHFDPVHHRFTYDDIDYYWFVIEPIDDDTLDPPT